MVNVILVGMGVTCLEPLCMLPWDRPRLSADRKILKGNSYMPDWFRFAKLRREGAGDVVFMSYGSRKSTEPGDGVDYEGNMRPFKRGLSLLRDINTRRRMYQYVTSLSFFDDILGAMEDGAQFVLQILFLVSCHPSESAAIAILFSVVFSLLRGGLKLMSALSDDIIKETFAAFACSLPSTDVTPRKCIVNRWAITPHPTNFDGDASFIELSEEENSGKSGDDAANQDISSATADATQDMIPSNAPKQPDTSNSCTHAPPKLSTTSKDDSLTGATVVFIPPLSGSIRRNLQPITQDEESGEGGQET